MEYLPPYHPELNPQERVWHLVRYEVTTNRYDPTVDLIDRPIRNSQRRVQTKQDSLIASSYLMPLL